MSQSSGSRTSSDKPLRVLFAPNEICGQMQALAEAFREMGHDAMAVDYGEPHPFTGANDHNLRLNRCTRAGRFARATAFSTWALQRFDVFHFFYGRSLLPNYWDLPVLRKLGKRVVVHFRGSDIRSQKWLVQANRFSPDFDPATLPPRSTATQQRRMQVWRKYADAILLSIPELTEVMPDGRVFQQSIDQRKWPVTDVPESACGKITIAHVASKRSCKGTEYVIDAVDGLVREGLPVTLDLVENVSHEEVQRRVQMSDIGVDEVIQGSYGNVAIEMMSIGRPVVAHLCDWYAEHRPDLPIVNANPSNLRDRLRTLVTDEAYRRSLALRGPDYVAQHHDVRSHVRQLASLYRGEEGFTPLSGDRPPTSLEV